MCVAAAIAGAAVVGAGAAIYSSNKAASAEKSAANTASNTQLGMFNQTQQNLSPFIGAGQTAQNQLTQQLPALTAPVVMNQAQLEQTPGYQFQLNQGLQTIAGQNAAKGLGISGAEVQGAQQYAQGLASSNYQQQFQNAVTNQTNSYNRLYQAAGLGENAAAGLGNNAVQTGANIGNNVIGAGVAQGGAAIAGGNAIGTAAQSVPNALLTQQYLNNQANGTGQYGSIFMNGQGGTQSVENALAGAGYSAQ